MANISIDTIRALINFLTVEKTVNNDISRQELLEYIAMNEQQLLQNRQLVASELYESLFIFAQQKCSNKKIASTLGFKFGQAISPERWGILGYIAYTSNNLHDALQNQRKYQSLIGSIGTPVTEQQSEKEQDNLLLKWLPAYHCSYHVVEEIITGWVSMARQLTLNQVQPSVIYFSHPCYEDQNSYQVFFNCPVIFNHDFSGLKIAQQALTLPLTKSDPLINQVLCQQADHLLNAMVEQSPVESISQFISNQLPFGVPEIDDAANYLQISTRTLQRKLSDNQHTFTGLIDIIRHKLAISYLVHTDTKIIYITQMLGFSEQSAFQRAFKRWTKQTPKQYREQNSSQHQ